VVGLLPNLRIYRIKLKSNCPINVQDEFGDDFTLLGTHIPSNLERDLQRPSPYPGNISPIYFTVSQCAGRDALDIHIFDDTNSSIGLGRHIKDTDGEAAMYAFINLVLAVPYQFGSIKMWSYTDYRAT